MPRTHLETDLLVIGAGGAGMMAALEGEAAGRRVILVDRSLIGRGGATVMAQMTVAAALGDDGPDDPQAHLADTLAAGRGLCDPALVGADVRGAAPRRSASWTHWKVGWARNADGAHARRRAPRVTTGRAACTWISCPPARPCPGRCAARCSGRPAIRRIGDLCITDIVVDGGQRCGAVGFSCRERGAVTIAAHAVIIATGGLTRLYRAQQRVGQHGRRRLCAGAAGGRALVDMEFVQFFPIGHLAPRLIGMDPIMWDPFRYKLGGRLLNGEGREFARRLRRAGGRTLRGHPRPRDLLHPEGGRRPGAARPPAAPSSASSTCRPTPCARRSAR